MNERCCQSCSIPLSKDPLGGGTEASKEKSTAYCSRCFKDGEFINPTMTLGEMQTLVKEKLVGSGVPGFVATQLAKKIGELDRWKKRGESPGG
jgi:hypothetical protein